MSSPACPECKHTNVEAYYACHTWPSTGVGGVKQWMSCVNCDSAIHYLCACKFGDEVQHADGTWHYQQPDCECDWSYTHGMNSGNPRWTNEQTYRPTWLGPEPEWNDNFILKHPDVPWFGI